MAAITGEEDFRKLVDQGYMSSHATQDKTRERVELERDLATQRARTMLAAALPVSTLARLLPVALRLPLPVSVRISRLLVSVQLTDEIAGSLPQH